MKIILLIGLPGSGKSTYGKSLGYPFLDDLMQNGGFNVLREIEREHEIKTLVISDSGLIWPGARKAFESMVNEILPVTEYEYVAWHNDPLGCYENIQRRNDGRVISLPALLQMSKTYVPPSGLILRPVRHNE